MDRYIDVVGEGTFFESAKTFVAHIILEVRAAKDETSLREVAELFDEAIRTLRKSGIDESELVEGGTDLRRPWYWKKQVGQHASRRIILKVKDFNKLQTALEGLEPLQSRNKDRRTIAIDMQQPEFDENPEGKSGGLVQAFEDAKMKATKLSQAMGCTLGPAISVEEAGWSKRNSGFSGDEDWFGDSSRFGGGVLFAAAPGSLAEEPEAQLQRPTRTIFVKVRAKFAIEH